MSTENNKLTKKFNKKTGILIGTVLLTAFISLVVVNLVAQKIEDSKVTQVQVDPEEFFENLDNNPSTQEFTLTKPKLTQKNWVFETTSGDVTIDTEFYNPNQAYVEEFSTISSYPFYSTSNGVAFMVYKDHKSLKSNFPYFYNKNTKEIMEPDLKSSVDSNSAIRIMPVDENELVLQITPEQNQDQEKFVVWDTSNNSIKEIKNLKEICQNEDVTKCNYISLIKKQDAENLLINFEYGDTCYLENSLYKFNTKTNEAEKIFSYNNEEKSFKQFLGFYENNFLIAEKTKIPNEQGYCEETTTDKLYSMDINQTIVKEFDLANVTNKKNLQQINKDSANIKNIYFVDSILTEDYEITEYILDAGTVNTYTKEDNFQLYKKPELPTELIVKETEYTGNIDQIVDATMQMELQMVGESAKTKESYLNIESELGKFKSLFSSTELAKFMPKDVESIMNQANSCGVEYEKPVNAMLENGLVKINYEYILNEENTQKAQNCNNLPKSVKVSAYLDLQNFKGYFLQTELEN